MWWDKKKKEPTSSSIQNVRDIFGRIYYDSEFTGLHRDSTLISISLISQSGNYFYAEFNDYAKDQIDDWIQEHVIGNLIFDKDCLIKHHADTEGFDVDQFNIQMRGSKDEVKKEVVEWLKAENSILKTKQVQIYSDCYAYDWMLLVDLIAGHAMKMPDFINYIPIDLSSVLWVNGIDPDISREEFAGISENDVTNFDISLPEISSSKHNSFFDTISAKVCFEKIYQMIDKRRQVLQGAILKLGGRIDD